LARKILLADDSVTAQNMGRKILTDAGYEVVTVNNGSAALKKIAELKPDLVILDVYMPGYSGLEVCQRLKESHDSARIPVLLSVGKLEPFKPEEAQRVHAEGYIVKPFEASELLSALSKLEDKVVPRAEPSKPGRFARAVAAAEEVSRAGRSQPTGEENGWKSRIGFPHQKAEPEEKVADDASIYNPINRDLRTVVETPAEMAAEKVAEQEQKLHQAEKAAEAGVDVAALAPAGLPKDVTPEEVAAIAAAAAQMQMLGAIIKDGPKASEEPSHPSPESAPPVNAEAIHETKEENKIENVASQAAAATGEHRGNQNDTSEEPQDLPVTMAAIAEVTMSANESASRWTAVAVALEGDEATISLDEEMQKVYAAFAAEVAASPLALPEAAPSEDSAAPAEPHLPVATMSNPEPQPVPQPEHAVSPDTWQTEPTPAGPSPSEAAAVASFVPAEPASLPDVASPSTQQSEAEIAPPVTAPVSPLEAHSEAAHTEETHPEPPPVAEFVAANHEPVAELVNSIVETAVPNFATPAPQESQPVPEPEPAIPEAATSSNAFAPIVEPQHTETQHTEEHKEDSETVKSTAAAWASWRQIRDAGDAKTVTAESSRQEFDVPVAEKSAAAAMAVAAGAEQSAHEAAATTTESPADIAGIVDSVLADLRPKLMAEISRKMGEKK